MYKIVSANFYYKTCVFLGNIGPDLEHLRFELRYQNEGLKEELEDKAGKRLDNRF